MKSITIPKQTLAGVLVTLFFTTFTPPSQAGDRQISRLVNQVRAQHGLPQLKQEHRLQKAAHHQATLMARKGVMSHKVSFGQSFKSRIKRVRYRGPTAENLAVGYKSLDRTLQGWLRSRGHRNNLLHPRMRQFGLSVVIGKDRKTGRERRYWAMVLGG